LDFPQRKINNKESDVIISIGNMMGEGENIHKRKSGFLYYI